MTFWALFLPNIERNRKVISFSKQLLISLKFASALNENFPFRVFASNWWWSCLCVCTLTVTVWPLHLKMMTTYILSLSSKCLNLSPTLRKLLNFFKKVINASSKLSRLFLTLAAFLFCSYYLFQIDYLREF